MNTQRIRVAIQKKGRLGAESRELLKRCGIEFSMIGERLIVHADNLPIDLLLVRDDDIPGLVMDGLVDLGIIGENELREVSLERAARQEACDYQILQPLGFGRCRLSIAIDENQPYGGVADLENKRIATTYPHLVRQHMRKQGVNCTTCILNGSVEVAPKAGLADAICDLVSTGATLEANGLKEAEVIQHSRAVLIQRTEPLAAGKQVLVDRLLVRMQGVLQAKESKYIMMHAPLVNLEAIRALLPGAENPTINPLTQDKERVALHMVSSEALFWETMESLKQLGASSILVLPIEKMME